MQDKAFGFEYTGSTEYWIKRYEKQGHSGSGSKGKLRKFKAQIINAFVKVKNIQSVIEFGCGDGSQLQLASYPKYLGLDVSPIAIQKCQVLFKDDSIKTFKLMSQFDGFIDGRDWDLGLAIDVLLHLIEQDIWEHFLWDLFTVSNQWVIIYDTNKDNSSLLGCQRHRNFTKWIQENIKGWSLAKRILNDFPEENGKASEDTSSADFYIYKKEI
jgi:SAM-dependent methyltransferase